jgi:hypothetical protein
VRLPQAAESKGRQNGLFKLKSKKKKKTLKLASFKFMGQKSKFKQ